jgi:hypothetical protein
MSESDSQSIKGVYFHGRQKLGIGEYRRLKHFTNQMPVGLPEDTPYCLRFSRAVNEVLRIKKTGNFTPEEEIHALERIIIGGESITECAKCIGANEKNLQKHIKVIRHNYGGAINVKGLREMDINQAELSAFITELILGKKGRGRQFNIPQQSIDMAVSIADRHRKGGKGYDHNQKCQQIIVANN